MTPKNKIITSFGSGLTSKDDPLYPEIISIGKLLAQNGWTVCCGGYFGTMEAICKGASEAGGKTIGITAKSWEREPNSFLGEEVKMANLMERLVELISIADAYIVFQGGTGTLVEISTALELMRQKMIPEKKMIFYTDFWYTVIDTLKLDSEDLKKMIKQNVKFVTSNSQISKELS